jgi:hypothetical protein
MNGRNKNGIRLPPHAGEGGEGEAACASVRGLAPFLTLHPKSDLSDFGPLIVPKSGKPDFGCTRGRGKRLP